MSDYQHSRKVELTHLDVACFPHDSDVRAISIDKCECRDWNQLFLRMVRLNGLRELTVRHCTLTDYHVGPIAEIRQLERLDLSNHPKDTGNNNLTAHCLKHLRNLPNLKRLCIGMRRINAVDNPLNAETTDTVQLIRLIKRLPSGCSIGIPLDKTMNVYVGTEVFTQSGWAKIDCFR